MFEAFNKRNLTLLDELIALDYVDHPRQLRGLESYKQYLTMLYKSFPDTHETIEDIIAEGDKVCIHLKGTATHTGKYRGLAPTGKKTTWESVVIWRIIEGKIVEMLAVVSDELDFLKQLGVIEYKGFPDENIS
ncbi:MAG: ester cyclase [Candidatus Methylarchaceae archaeon HK02M1]|nr:ester cyclase [Candidatus Methylarchaceae archaeon HK02M1]